MNEWICLKCRTVFMSKEGKHCGEPSEIFSIDKHGASLVSSSNSWVSIWEMWKNDPVFQEISDELTNEGSYGAATAINEFIRRLKETSK
jgi:hypothetical protein